MKNLKSKFDVQLFNTNFILITDNSVLTNTISITNDAENVVEYLYKYYDIGNKRIFYEDTWGRVDELLHDNEIFIDFKSGYNNIEEFNKNINIIK